MLKNNGLFYFYGYWAGFKKKKNKGHETLVKHSGGNGNVPGESAITAENKCFQRS